MNEASPAGTLGAYATREAERYGIECLLNCVLREVALPRGEARLDYRGGDRPEALRTMAVLRMRVGRGRLVIAVAQASRLGRCHFASAPFHRPGPGARWQPLGLDALTQALAPQIATLVADSRDSLELFLRRLHVLPAPLRSSADALRDSEQFQLWGDAMDPAPKARGRVDPTALAYGSPETGSALQLQWFAVDPGLIRWLGPERGEMLDCIAGLPDLYPCHPWAAARLQENPAFRQLLASGRIAPAGLRGLPLYPTGSVRTLYHPALPAMLRMSVPARIDGENGWQAWSELERTVRLSHLLGRVLDTSEAEPGGQTLLLLREPSASTLALDSPGAGQVLADGFGIVYPMQIPVALRDRLRPRVASSLFTWSRNELGRPASIRAIALTVEKLTLPTTEAAVLWLSRYVRLLAGGVMRAWLAHGVALAPRLPDVLIGSDAVGLPARLWLRGTERVRLLRRRWAGEWRQGRVLCDEEEGWRHLVDALLVGNIAEAVFHLALATGVDEAALWGVVRCEFRHLRDRLGGDRLAGLCDGEAWPTRRRLGPGEVLLPSAFVGLPEEVETSRAFG